MWGAGGRGPRGRRRILACSPASTAGTGAPVSAPVPWWAGRGVEVLLAANNDTAHTGATLPGRVLAFVQCDFGEHEVRARLYIKLHGKTKTKTTNLESVAFFHENQANLESLDIQRG